MASSKLLQLPSELQTAIISCLLRPENLAQVCLVSKQLQRIALPLLYHDFSINVTEWTDAQLEYFTAPGHAGHRYIRSIDIDSQDIEGEEQALKVAKDVLQILPRNGLRSFRCPLEDGVDNDLMILLAGSQRNLHSICIGPLRENALNLIDALRPWPPQVETIVVPWRLLSRHDFTFYHDLIERSWKRLKVLTVRVHDFAWLKGNGANAQACEELARGLFGHIKDTRYERPQLELKDINLQNQDLSTFDSTWYHYIDLTRLRTIQIWNCHSTDHMLKCLLELSRTHPLRLEGLVLSFEYASSAPLLTEDFLGCISGLRYLNICYIPSVLVGSGRHPFNIRCLSNHTDTLQDIYLGIGTNSSIASLPNFWMTGGSDIQWLARSCRDLKQLAVAMPELEMDDALAGRWGQYLESLIELAKMPRLKVLRLLTWPVDCNRRRYVSNFHPIRWRDHRAQYLKQLDVVADGIARTFARWRDEHRDQLSVITFGNAERSDNVWTLNFGAMRMCKPVTYKIRRVESEFGMLLDTVRMDPAEMRYEEPIAFVFDEDTDQGLSLESYPWGD